jgi:hypothetical protein
MAKQVDRREPQKVTGLTAKAFLWLGGLLLAFVGTYITAVLNAVIPAPKALLCELSLGFCPSPTVITFGATDTDYIVDRGGVGQAIAEDQIGMLHNQVLQNSRRANMVKYRVLVETAGEYDLEILYASAESRPVELRVNAQLVENSALQSTTRGWTNEYREWSPAYRVSFVAGNNDLLIRRDDVFPHLSKIRLTQVLAR